MKHILAAVDGSDCSFRALEHAGILATATGAELTVLFVNLQVIGRKDVYIELDQKSVSQIEKEAKRLISKSGSSNMAFVVRLSRDAAYAIVDTAIELKADLIVVGASGKGGLKKFLLGSVSDEVVRKSICPVTIVH